MNRRKLLISGAALAAVPRHTSAQSTWPSQPIKMVVPFAPGGSTDILARVISQKLELILGKPIIIENRPGAAGVPAATAVARADPDGYTLLMGHIGTLTFNPALLPSLSYDPKTDFAAVARVATVPNLLAVHPSVPAQTLKEFIDYAKANPGKLNYGSAGNGSNTHVSMAYFLAAAGLSVVHVAYRGAGPAINDLVGGHVQALMAGGPALLPLGRSGQLRILGVSSKERVPFAPDLPTLAATLPGFEAVQWYGIVAPAKTPPEIVARLNQLVNQQLSAPDVAETLAKDGAIAAPGTPDDFANQIASEIDVWRAVIKNAGIRLE